MCYSHFRLWNWASEKEWIKRDLSFKRKRKASGVLSNELENLTTRTKVKAVSYPQGSAHISSSLHSFGVLAQVLYRQTASSTSVNWAALMMEIHTTHSFGCFGQIWKTIKGEKIDLKKLVNCSHILPLNNGIQQIAEFHKMQSSQ